MTKGKISLFMLIGLLMVPVAGYGAETTAVTEQESTEATPAHVANKICPVSHETVDSMDGPAEVEYNGKVYNLCCKMCARDFKQDPEKYIKVIEDEMKAANPEGEGASTPASDEHMHDHDHTGN